MSTSTRLAAASGAVSGPEPAPPSTPQPVPGPTDGAPEDFARDAVASARELHVATSQLLPVAQLAAVTQAVQTLVVLVGDITQDLRTLATNYRLDAGGISHEHLDLRRQAGVTGADAARKFAQGVGLLRQASTWLNQAHHDTTLMADLADSNAPKTSGNVPAPSSLDRTKQQPNGRSRRPATEHDGPML